MANSEYLGENNQLPEAFKNALFTARVEQTRIVLGPQRCQALSNEPFEDIFFSDLGLDVLRIGICKTNLGD